MKTIAVILTPPGRGGIAVIALRGPEIGALLRSIFRPWKSHAEAIPGVLQLGHLVGEDGQVLDEAVVQVEGDCVHVNIHGGPWVTQAVMDLLRSKGAVVEPAEPGTAFEPAHPKWNNPAIGREMLEVLPRLNSPLAIAAVANQWSAGLSQLAAIIHELHEEKRIGKIDDDEPLPSCLFREIRGQGPAAAALALRQAADAMPRMRRLIEPAEVVLAGPPNAGKSTLANALCGRPMSIVHEAPGTTRDWVRELALIQGVPIWLTDTAGIWEVPTGSLASAVDAEAVLRAHERLRQADLVVLLGEDPDVLVADAASAGRPLLRVRAKADLLVNPQGAPKPVEEARLTAGEEVSAQTGQGMDGLRLAILSKLGLAGFDPAAPMAFTPRQAGLLRQSAAAIKAGNLQAAVARLVELTQDRGH